MEVGEQATQLREDVARIQARELTLLADVEHQLKHAHIEGSSGSPRNLGERSGEGGGEPEEAEREELVPQIHP
jgi:hypothetical protein